MNQFSYSPNIQSSYDYTQNIPVQNMPVQNLQAQMPQSYIPYQSPPNNYQQPIQMNKYEKFDNNEYKDDTKINWYLIGKKVVVYTILFLVMSHLIMSKLICNYIPFIGDNEIICMVTKGVIMSILVIIIQAVL